MLEASTEQIWHDFTGQYSNKKGSSLKNGNKKIIADLKDKYLEQHAEDASEEPAKKRQRRVDPAQEVDDADKPLWSRIWTALMDQLDLSQVPAADDETSSLDEEQDNEEHTSSENDQVPDKGEKNLNKREKKQQEKATLN